MMRLRRDDQQMPNGYSLNALLQCAVARPAGALRAERPEFEPLVCIVDNKVVGMLIFYEAPFTYHGAPKAVMKELYVDENYRSRKVGTGLLSKMASVCIERGYIFLDGTVAAWNEKAISFYESLGGEIAGDWHSGSPSPEKMRELD